MSDAVEHGLLAGAVRLLQPARGHRAGTDAVLLAAAAPVAEGDLVVDVGAGTGAVGLMIAARATVTLLLVEKDTTLAALCGRNLALNGREGRAIAVDVLDRGAWPAAGLQPGTADLVATNPPFLEAGRGRPSPDAERAAAHVLPPGAHRAWLAACAALLRPGGRLAVVQRADRLDAVLDGLRGSFGGVTLRFVHPRAADPAHRVLVTATKGSRAPLAVAPPLVLHDASGAFTPEAAALHRGEAALA